MRADRGLARTAQRTRVYWFDIVQAWAASKTALESLSRFAVAGGMLIASRGMHADVQNVTHAHSERAIFIECIAVVSVCALSASARTCEVHHRGRGRRFAPAR